MEDDERFKHVLSDPKFRRIPKSERKVKIDKRFRSMFENKNFKVSYTVDKHGRPVKHSSSEDLKRYYELSSEEEEEEFSEEETEAGQYVKAPQNEADVNDKGVTESIKKKLQDLDVDYARGEGRLYSESSSDDSGSEEEEKEVDSEVIEHKWGELDADAEKTDEITRRLAACNMDWDRIHAVDLMVLFHSFLPPGGCIETITIYPSEFGKKRMEEEEIKGPIELVEMKAVDENNDEENEEGSKYHMERLRQYQLNRLKYYYAVIVCDSASTANKIYTECDGMEYESSATKIDLRFIPDDMTFEDEAKEMCDKLPELNKYQPRFFTTTALQQAKVDLTWDETNPDRVEMTQKLSTGKVDDVTDADLEAYLALSSDEEDQGEMNDSDEEEEEKNPIDKYKALLQDIEEEEQRKKSRDVEMEVTWGIDLEKKTEELVKKKMSEKEERTPFQEYLEKRKQKRKERKKSKLNKEEGDSDIPSDVDMNDPYFAEEFEKPEFKRKKNKDLDGAVESGDDAEKQAELELLLMNEDDGKKHFSLKRIQEQESEKKAKKKRKKLEEPQKQDDFEVDVRDARFSALYTSHHYNIDPTDPHYKKTKAMEAIVQEKLKRRSGGDSEKVVSEEQRGKKKDVELSVLVKSVKRKANALKNK